MKTPTTMIKAIGDRVSRKNRLLLGIVSGGTLIAAGVMATAPAHDPTVVEERAWPVSTMVAAPQQLAPQLQLFGRVESPGHAQLSAALTATVTSVSVAEGQFVRSGEVLLTLDDADEVLRLQQRQADLRDAQAALATVQREQQADRAVLKHMRELYQLTHAKSDRLSQLAQRNLVATEQLEDTRQQVARQAISLAQQEMKVDNHPHQLAMAEADIQRASASLDEQELKLSRTLVVAPFDGRVSRVDVAPGDRIMEGQQLIALYDTEGMRVRAAIPSDTAMRLRQSLHSGEAVVAVLNHGGTDIELRLQQLAAEVVSGRSGVDGLFNIASGSQLLELGRAVELTVELPALQDVVAVPVQSLYGEDRIYTVADGRLKAIPVASMGQRVDHAGNFQILVRAAELQAGTPVLTTTLPRANTGLRVEVIDKEMLSDSSSWQTQPPYL